MNHIIADPKTRKYIYGIAVALFGLLAVYGIVEAENVELWLILAASVLGVGTNALAAPNTPDDKLRPQGTEQGL